MDFIAVQKFIRMSPKKVRVVAGMVKNIEPSRAVEVLAFSNKRASLPIIKTIKTAIANAKQKGISETELIFKEIQINEGPRLKRGIPVSKGRWHPIKKRMSHIRVVLTTRKSEVTTPKPETGSNIQNIKSETKEKKNVKKV